MSRALNINATVADVVALSGKHSARISAIEELYPSGTRVVFVTGDEAARIATAFGRRVITGAVHRTPWQQRRVS